jgi:Protein of unknown function (DUF2851)
MTTNEWSEPDLAVAEIQGLYGPFTFTERLLQKIWLRGEFDATQARIEDGRSVRIFSPGRWNLLGGPDFRQARLQLGGQEITGDVELHLHAGDWAAHAHAADDAYDRVVLHVVLFPPAAYEQARRTDGSPIPTLVLLPLLLHDLEEYAAEEAVETLARRTDWRAAEELSRLPVAEVTTLLRAQAEERWRQKVRFARRRVERLGWMEACHHTVLEILGYRFNRTPMLKTAARAPLAEWVAGRTDVGQLFAAEAGSWSMQGVRPANHPYLRLGQYAAWCRAQPDWPDQLVGLAASLPNLARENPNQPTAVVRRNARLSALRARLAREIATEAVGGTRFDNLVCDGFLPLLAAKEQGILYPLWFHWLAGDLPPSLGAILRSLAICDGRAQPVCHGVAQGLLGWMLAREANSGRAAQEA